VSTQDADQVKQTATRNTRARTSKRRIGFSSLRPWLPLSECYRNFQHSGSGTVAAEPGSEQHVSNENGKPEKVEKYGATRPSSQVWSSSSAAEQQERRNKPIDDSVNLIWPTLII
jgi:hypothetical protein